MALSEAQANANKKYHEKFDDIKVRVPKGKRQKWQAYASQNGESLNGFIVRVVSAAIAEEREGRQEF